MQDDERADVVLVEVLGDRNLLEVVVVGLGTLVVEDVFSAKVVVVAVVVTDDVWATDVVISGGKPTLQIQWLYCV